MRVSMFVGCLPVGGYQMSRLVPSSIGRFFVSQSHSDVITISALARVCRPCACVSFLSGAGQISGGQHAVIGVTSGSSRKFVSASFHHQQLRFCSSSSTSSGSSHGERSSSDSGKQQQQQQPPDSSKLPPTTFKMKRFDTMRSTLISIGICAVGCIIVLLFKRKKEQELELNRQRTLGKASLGGSFSLVDHNGRPCSSDDLLGQWVLLYFGFTHCPDVCPDELEKIAQAVDNVDKWMKSGSLQPIFITVDPYRDTPEAVAKYVKEFHPKLLGLTGTPEQVKEACKAYRVYFSEGPKDDDNDYIVDHTIITYLVDPEGKFVDYYGQTKTAKQISDSIIFNITKYNQLVNKSFW